MDTLPGRGLRCPLGSHAPAVLGFQQPRQGDSGSHCLPGPKPAQDREEQTLVEKTLEGMFELTAACSFQHCLISKSGRRKRDCELTNRTESLLVSPGVWPLAHLAGRAP